MAKSVKLAKTGAELKALRLKVGILASDLCKPLGLRNEVLSRIESGRLPVPEDLPARYRAAVLDLAAQRHEQAAVLVGATP